MKCISGLLLVVSIWGQNEPQMSVSGRVLNSVTRSGVPKALVQLYPIGQFPKETLEMFTSADGSYEFSGLSMGSYRISATRPHFAPPLFHKIEVLPRGNHKGHNLELNPLSQMLVTVRDLQGKPVPLARVEVMRIQAENGFLVERRVSTSSTDDRGVIRFYDWSPGKYLVRVAGRHGETNQSSKEEAILTDTHLALEPEQRLIELEPGREQQVRFGVAIHSASSIKGTVIGLEGSEPVQIEVVDGQGVAVAVKSLVDPVRGSFRIEGLLSGEWLLRAVQVANNERREAIARVDIKGRDVKGVELRLGPVQAVPVKIECPGKSAPPGMRMVDSPCNVNVTYASKRDRVTVPLVGLLTGQTVRLPQSGNYQIVVNSLDEDRYPAVVEFAGRPVDSSKAVPVDATQAIPALEIEMREGAASLTVLYGQNPKNKARQLLLVRDLAGSDGVRMIFAGGQGFIGLEPGGYALYELFDDAAAYQEREVLAKLNPIRTLRLAAGEKKTLNLDEEQ